MKQNIIPVTSPRITERALQVNEQLHQQKEREEEAEQAQKQQQLDQQLAAFRLTFEAEFISSDFGLADLHPHYQWSEHKECEAVIRYAGIDFHLRIKQHGEVYPGYWDVDAYTEGTTHMMRREYERVIKPNQLAEGLLKAFGKRAADYAVEQQKQAIKDAAYAKAREQEARAEREKARIRDEQLAQAQLEDKRIRALIETVCQQKLAELFFWPDGTSIVFYKAKWVNAIGRNSDGNAVVNTGEGYTLTTGFDREGCITLLSTATTKGHRVKLDLLPNGVQWHEITASSLGELPRDLIESLSVTFPHIEKHGWSYSDDYDNRLNGLYYEEKTRHSEGYSEVVGKQPVSWVRDLVNDQL